MKRSRVKVLDSIFSTKESLIDFVGRSIWKAVLQQFLPLSCRWAIAYSVTWRTDADFGFTFWENNIVWKFNMVVSPITLTTNFKSLFLASSCYANDETLSLFAQILLKKIVDDGWKQSFHRHVMHRHAFRRFQL